MAQPAAARVPGLPFEPGKPLDLGGREFADHKYEIYARLREEAPVSRGRISLLKVHLVARYEDCAELLRDPRFVRNRATARGGGSRMPFPMPRSVAFLAESMIVQDDPEHRRLRGLVNQAFKPAAIARIEERVRKLTHELLDAAGKRGRVDLMQAYCLPIPVTVISELVGVADEDMPMFARLMNSLTQGGMSGLNILRALFWEMPRTTRFMRELIARKRSHPADDILTGLIHAEEDGERLTEDELVSLVFLLIVAGFETTVHLITNGVVALLRHPDELARLRADPALLEPAVEEILRYCGPIHGTKMNYATEDLELRGVPIRRGAPVVPLLGSANRDPRAFDEPERFDVGRSPNRHLAFGHGAHFCLGAQLARMETRLALEALLERNPKLRLAVPPEALRVQPLALWHRHESLPVELG